MSKKDKAPKKIVKKRATRLEMCDRLEKERNKLYYKRRKVQKELAKIDLSKINKDLYLKKERVLNGQIATVSAKRFKCSVRYKKLLNRKRVLKKKVKELTEDYKINYKSLLNQERSDRKLKIEKLTKEVDDIEDILKMPLIERTKDVAEKMGAGVGVVEISPDALYISINGWEIRKTLDDYIQSNQFDTISMQGQVFDIKTQSYEVLRIGSDLEDNIDRLRQGTKLKISTPELNSFIDYPNRRVDITWDTSYDDK